MQQAEHTPTAARTRSLRAVWQVVDDWLLAIVGALLCMTVLVQWLAAYPALRAFADRLEGRFIPVNAGVSASAYREQAAVTLYLAPAQPAPDIWVLCNGRKVADFRRDRVTLLLRQGDTVSIVLHGKQRAAWVEVDHDDPNLLYPAAGQVFTIPGGVQRLDLPSAQFLR